MKKWKKTDDWEVAFNNYNDNVDEIEQGLNNRYTKQEVDDKFNELGHTIKRYGVRRKLGATTAELERIGNSIGLVANADTNLESYNVVVNDFDTIYPWSHMKKCIITDTGKVIYETDPDYEVANGDYMVEVPPFYIKHTNDGEDLEYWVSELGGADYEKVDKFYIGRFKTSEGHKSIPYVAPLVSMSRPNFRTGATSKGAGWGLIDMKAHYALRTLYQVEFAHLNSQLKLGTGVTSARYSNDDVALIAENNTNRIVVSETTANAFEIGETISIGTTRGNVSVFEGRLITEIKEAENGNWQIVFDGNPVDIAEGRVVYASGQHSGKTLDLTSSSGTSKGRNGIQSISYRGIEDIFGNVDEWVDGSLINDHQNYVFENRDDYADTLTANAIEAGYANINENGYSLEMGYDINNKYVEFPIMLGGGSSTGYTDYYYQATGLRAPRVGGYWNTGSSAGLFSWYLANAPSTAFVAIGSRLLFIKP